MVFSSLSFIFVFLPIVLLIFYSIRKELRFGFLLVASLFFYFMGENYLIWVMLTTTIIDYICGIMISGGIKTQPMALPVNGQRTIHQKFWLALSIVSNLSLLGYFKYYNFFVEATIKLLHSAGLSSSAFDGFTQVTLPLGISFYTFQSMSYTIDVYRGHVTANRNFINFGMFVTMFPQLVAGPIVRYTDVDQQIKHHVLQTDNFVYGIKRFIIGLGKKVLIANTLGQLADQVYSLPPENMSLLEAWIGTVAYALQIYFDFSGYSCMAIGLGKMFGFTFPENFNYPYTSTSVKEFWTRWHMTLSTWFRDYLYIPLGGNRISSIVTIRNLFVVFILCGVWHGAAWTFILWGVFHGSFLMLERTKIGIFLKDQPNFIQRIYFLLIILLSWVVFRSDSIAQAKSIYINMFTGSLSISLSTISMLTTEMIGTFIIGLVLSMPVFKYIQKKNQGLSPWQENFLEIAYFGLIMLIFILSIKSLLFNSFNPFIYYRF